MQAAPNTHAQMLWGIEPGYLLENTEGQPQHLHPDELGLQEWDMAGFTQSAVALFI